MKNFITNFRFLFVLPVLLFVTACSDPDEEVMQDLNSQINLEAEQKVNNAAITKEYSADLDELNDSGVEGTAHLSLMGDQLTVKIYATGLEPNRLHPQHIHGFAENNRNSKCPPASADDNGDGFVSVGEGAPFYGGILIPLVMDVNDPLSFPVANENGVIDFEMTYNLEDLEGLEDFNTDVTPLQNTAIVLHGMTVEDYVNAEGETVSGYIITLPVACGQVSPAQGRNR